VRSIHPSICLRFADLAKFKKAVKGVPFWLAGSYAHPSKLCDVKDLGGQGIQVGSLFSLSKESGLDDAAKQSTLVEIAAHSMEVFTDPVASPTGYPFKVLKKEGTLSDEKVYDARPRMCSLGYLRTPFIGVDGKIGYRCPSEPVKDWVRKGGAIEATIGRKCLCNCLMANVGLPQVRRIMDENGETHIYKEDILITVGDEVNECRQMMEQDKATGEWGYSAAKVVDYLKSEWNERQAQQSLTDTIFSESEHHKLLEKDPTHQAEV
jgi:NAD(P)H-dependent flavin oxidoreductase YrpB (nitropropane dioxygenase family)